jgi:hypothetical protein
MTASAEKSTYDHPRSVEMDQGYGKPSPFERADATIAAPKPLPYFLPWNRLADDFIIRDADGDLVATVDLRSAAAFIVQSANSRAALVESLADTLRMLRAAHMQCGVAHDSNKRVIKARAALKLAAGEA